MAARKAANVALVERRQQQRLEQYERRVRPGLVRDLPAALEVIEVIEVEAPSDAGIWLAHPATWHADLFRHFVEGHVGETFPVGSALARFADRGGNKYGAFDAVREYLWFLGRQGYLDFAFEGSRITSDITVLADSKHPRADPVTSTGSASVPI